MVPLLLTVSHPWSGLRLLVGVTARYLPDMASGVSNSARSVCWDPLQTVGAKRVHYILETMLCTKPSRRPSRSAVGFVFGWDALSSIQTLRDNTPTTEKYNIDLSQPRREEKMRRSKPKSPNTLRLSRRDQQWKDAQKGTFSGSQAQAHKSEPKPYHHAWQVWEARFRVPEVERPTFNEGQT